MDSAWIVFLVLCVDNVFSSARSLTIPPLVEYDDHDKCFREHNPGAFCIAKVILKQEVDPIDSLRIVTDFRHNLLERGVCVQDCEREVANLSEEQRVELYQPQLPFNRKHYIGPTELWKDELEPYKHRFSRMLNICMNNRLQWKYNLSQLGYTELEYCMTNNQTSEKKKMPTDWWTIIFCVIVVTLIGTVSFANLAELFGGDRMKEHAVVSSFSVRRNWARFTADPDTELQRDFNYIDGLRLPITLFMLSTHCFTALSWPTLNTEEIEEQFRNPLLQPGYSASGITVQTVFVIGGLLLTVNFLKYVHQNPKLEYQYFRSQFVNQLIRTVPVYYFVLLLHTVRTSLPGQSLSPIRAMPMVTEQNVCRKNGWTNMLFINNLPFVEDSCFLQTWYIGADLQLFVGALMLLAVMWKYRKTTKPILGVTVAAGLIIPAWLTHFLQLEAMIPLRLSDMVFDYNYQRWFRHIYMPSYTNINCYVAGMVVGYLYHQTKHNKLNLKSLWLYRLLKRISVPLVVLAMSTIPLYYRYEIQPSWLTLLHSVLIRNHAVLYCSICFCENFQNPPGLLRRMLDSRLLSRLGRQSYSVYLVHMTVIRTVLNNMPIGELNDSTLMPTTAVVILSSYLAGFLVFFVVEQPMCSILQHWYFGKAKAKFQ